MAYEFIEWPSVAVPTYGDDGEGGIRQGAMVIVPGTDPGGIPIVDGEGNQIGFERWKYITAGYPLSYDSWAHGKMRSMFGTGSPNWYDWIILGEYLDGANRKWIFEMLRQAGAAAGVPANYDWTRCLAVGARQHWEQFAQPYRYLETPAIVPVHAALACAMSEYPTLKPFVEQTGPGSQLWIDTLAAANARRDAHSDVEKSLATIAVLAVLTMGAAAYFAPAAGAATGSTVAAGTATVQGAELAALVEAGTIGAEGAFLEAAALTGSTVTYSTATGAVIGAVTPAGASIAYDSALDAYSQFGIQPAQVAEAVQLPEPVEVTEPLEVVEQTELVDTTNYADKLKQQVVKMAQGQAQSLVVNELRKAISGEQPARLAPQQGVAPEGKLGDIVLVLAFGIVAGAFVLRKARKKSIL